MGRRRKGLSSVEDAAETRGTIIRIAHDLFMEHGYRDVTTRQIAGACGLTQPALYHYFADKQSLYVEVIRNVLDNTKTAMERITKQYRNMRERLFQAVSYVMLNMPDVLTQLHRDIEHELSSEARRTVQRFWMESYLMPIAAIFGEGLQEGRLRDPGDFGTDPVTSAYLLLGIIQGAGTGTGSRNSSGSGEASAEAYKRASMLVDVLLYGLSSDEYRRPEDQGVSSSEGSDFAFFDLPTDK